MSNNSIQHIRGTLAEHSTYTGRKGEISLITDSTNDRVPTGEIRIHDGATASGVPIKLGTSSSPLTSDIYLASGSGINFDAYATSGNPSSNLLDDYEEGTWVPDVFHVSTNNSTWTTKQGFYIKIGRQVTLWGRCDSGNSGTAGSGLRLNGFPFSAATSQVFAHAIGSFTYNGTASHADKWQLVNALYADSYGSGNHTTQVSYIGFFLTYFTD